MTQLRKSAALAALWLLFSAAALSAAELRGSGDLGIVVERASGAIQIIETTTRTSLARIAGLGDLSHASAVFSRDGRYAYVFGRDGGLSKVDLLERQLAKRSPGYHQGGRNLYNSIRKRHIRGHRFS